MVRTLRAADGRQCAGVEAALCSTVSGSVTTRISARSGGRGPGREKSVGAVLVAVGRHIGVHDAGQWTLLAGECALSYSQPPQRCISHHIISYHIISYHLPPTNLGRNIKFWTTFPRLLHSTPQISPERNVASTNRNANVNLQCVP